MQGIVSPTDNTMAGRTIDGIYLAAADNIQGGHEVMNLATGKQNTCSRVTEIPITESVIKAVEALAHKEGFKSLKVSNRHGQVLWDSAWVAGVDYDEENEEEEGIQEYYGYEDEEEDIPDLDDDFEEIDQEELDDILADEVNPSQTQEEVEEEAEEEVEEEVEEEAEEEAEEEETDDIDDDEEESTQDDDDDEVPEAIDEDSESGTHLRRSTRPRAEREKF